MRMENRRDIRTGFVVIKLVHLKISNLYYTIYNNLFILKYYILQSLLAWECELKFLTMVLSAVISKSLLAWECELKYRLRHICGITFGSLLAWECELKYEIKRHVNVITGRSLCWSVN